VRIVPVDLETEKFAPGYGAPKLVCAQWDEGEGPRVVTRRRGALVHMQRLLEDPTVLLVGHNVSYDSAVLAAEGLIEEVFAAYEAGRIVCTWVFERLGEISGYSERKNLDLATCCKAHGLKAPTKVEGLATSFGQFLDADEIPEPQRTYCIEDLYVGPLYERQRRRFKDVPQRALERLSYRQFVLQLMSVWGMRVDVDAARALEQEAREELESLRALAREWGFLHGKTGETLNTKALQAAVLEAYGPSCPRTATGLPARSELALSEADDPRLRAFAKYNGLIKTISNDVPNLLAAGGRWVSTRYGIADTTRTTSGGSKKGSRDGVIAMQNLRQKGGVRECIRPRPGRCFYNVDASGLELCTHAQVCLDLMGRGHAARMINDARNPGALHTAVAARIAGMSVERFKAWHDTKDPEAVQIRTRAKNANFGFMGGLGAQKFCDYVRVLSKGKTLVSPSEAQELKQAWAEANPDFAAYLKWPGDVEGDDGTYEVELPGYGIVRRGIWYCAVKNNRFQALAAAVMTEVLIDLVRECYIGKLSPARACLFVHDELLIEVDPRDGHEFDLEFMALAEAASRRVMPDVITVWVAELCDRYSKASKRVIKDGRLTVWSPEERKQ
jgi:hypothetical protein